MKFFKSLIVLALASSALAYSAPIKRQDDIESTQQGPPIDPQLLEPAGSQPPEDIENPPQEPPEDSQPVTPVTPENPQPQLQPQPQQPQQQQQDAPEDPPQQETPDDLQKQQDDDSTPAYPDTLTTTDTAIPSSYSIDDYDSGVVSTFKTASATVLASVGLFLYTLL